MGTVPVPPVVAVGQQISASFWNTLGIAADVFTMNPPLCEIYQTTGTTTSTGGTVILFDTETSDTDNMHSTSSNTGRITFNTPGRYDLNIFVDIGTSGLASFNIMPRINGASSLRTFPLGGGPREAIIHLSKVFNTGDYLEILVASTTSAATVPNGQYGTGVQVRWVSAS